MHAMILAAALAAASTSAPPVEPGATHRYAVRAELRAAPAETGNGRYRIEASARLDAGASGRYAVKALGADCGTPAETVFSDSFE